MLGATVLIDSQRMQTEVGQKFAHLLMSVEQTSMAARADDDDGFRSHGTLEQCYECSRRSRDRQGLGRFLPLPLVQRGR